MEEKVNLEGTEWISNIPGIYFDSVSKLVDKLGDVQAGSYISKIGLGTGSVIDLTVNLIKDPNDPSKTIASTVISGVAYYYTGLLTDAIVFGIIGSATAALGITAPLWLTVSGVGVAVYAAATWGNDFKNEVYKAVQSSSDMETIINSPQVTGKITQEEFILESVTNDPNFCKDIFPQYLNYRQIVDIKSGSTLAESVRYDNTTNEITISNSTSDNQNFYLNETLKNNDIDKATINDIVYIKQDLTNQTSLQIRNLLTDINSVNILLSNVLIKTDEKLDLGEKGIYTVKSGDTFSQIANNNGLTTKELLEKNTWLIKKRGQATLRKGDRQL